VLALQAHYGVALDDDSIRRYQRMDAIMELFHEQNQSHFGFDAHWESDVYRRGRMLNRYPSEVVVSFIMRAFPTLEARVGKRVLDLGCGAGNNVRFLARDGFDVLGIDGSQTAIETARQRLEADGLKAELMVMDFTALDLPDATFDCVIDRGSVTCNRRAEIETVLDTVRSVLKPGGLFFSQMYSARTAGLEYGRPHGDGSYDSFTEGYFVDQGRIFFATREDIDALFGTRFAKRSIQHVVTEDGEGRVVDASWETVWRR